MKIHYATPWQFSVVPPKGTWGSSGISDRCGIVTALRDVADDFMIHAHVPSRNPATVQWLREQKIHFAPLHADLDEPDLLVVEQFKPHFYFQQRVKRFYQMLARYAGPVAYLQNDPDWGLDLDTHALRRFIGPLQQKSLARDKTYWIVTPGRNLAAVESYCVQQKSRLLGAEAHVLEFDLAAVTMNNRGPVGPIRMDSPRMFGCFGQDESQRLRQLRALIDATRPRWSWNLYGRWPEEFMGGQPRGLIPQRELQAVLAREVGVVVNLYRTQQITLGWQPPRDFEALMAGVPMLVPADAPVAQRPGFASIWTFASLPEFVDRAGALSSMIARARLAQQQQAWLAAAKVEAVYEMQRLVDTIEQRMSITAD